MSRSHPMMQQLIYPQLEELMMSSGKNDKPRRKLYERSPLNQAVQLGPRDQRLLATVATFRMLNTSQLSLLFWQADPLRRLRYWGFTPAESQALVAQFTNIIELTDLLKWLLHLDQILKAAYPSPAQAKVRTWLTDLNLSQPEVMRELTEYLHQLTRTTPRDWLLTAMTNNLPLPQAYLQRPGAERPSISRACTARLRLLYDEGLLEKQEPATRTTEGKAPSRWFLSEAGRAYVATLLKKKPTEMGKLDLKKAGEAFLVHLLRTNDIRIAITQAAEESGCEIVEWRDDLDLRRFHSRASEKVTAEIRGREVTFGVVPDGYFWLQVPPGKHGHFFVECDMGTVVEMYSQAGLKDWRRKVIGYGLYYKNRYSIAYPEAQKSLRILVVTVNQTRLNNMKAVTAKVAGNGAHRYYFTTFERLQMGSALTAPIWERADKEGLISLV
jgi:hypothetical protein